MKIKYNSLDDDGTISVSGFYSEEDQLCAISKNTNSLYYIRNQTEDAKKLAVCIDGEALYYVINPSFDVVMLAINQNPFAIRFVYRPNDELILAALKLNATVVNSIYGNFGPLSQQYILDNNIIDASSLIKKAENPLEELITKAINELKLISSFFGAKEIYE